MSVCVSECVRQAVLRKVYATHHPHSLKTQKVAEKVIQSAIHLELFRRNVVVVRERVQEGKGEGFSVHTGRVDLEIAGRFFLELKVQKNAQQNPKQLTRYRAWYARNGVIIEKSAVVYFQPRTKDERGAKKGVWVDNFSIEEFRL